MDWLQALILGLVQGLTEYLPVSSSGHLAIGAHIFGLNGEENLTFTVAVHVATVLSTLVILWGEIKWLFHGLLKGRMNDETRYALNIVVSMIPVGIVGVFFKDKVEQVFGSGLAIVGAMLLVTAFLLAFSDFAGRRRALSAQPGLPAARNGISYWQALAVGVGQACAVAPGLSRSGTTIATGLLCGVKREAMAQFSFLMVLAPILGEQLLDIVKGLGGTAPAGGGAGPLCLALGFLAAFFSGLLACRAMIALVKKARLSWFSVYCVAVAILIFLFA